MEYTQLTLNDYQNSKKEIRENIGGIVKSFVRIGWNLTKIANSQAYKMDGYSTIAEFAKAEYDMNPSGVSRFMKVYETYSVDGDTPEIKEEYRNFKFTQLVDMLQLSEKDRELIRPEMPREAIRELNRFNKESENNPENLTAWMKEPEDVVKKGIYLFYKNNPEIVKEMKESDWQNRPIQELVDIVNPKGNAFYNTKKGIFILMYDIGTGVTVKEFNEEPVYISWEQFFENSKEILDKITADEEEKQQEDPIPGQDSILNHEDYMQEEAEKSWSEEIAPAQKEEKKEEPLSVLGYPLRVYPEGSLISTEGCGKHDCFSCHRDGCEIRQKDCYCVEAPIGKPFPCTTLNVVENIRIDVGDKCQFVNHDLAFHGKGDGEPVPCCKKCNNPCGYECRRSVESRNEEKPHSIAHDEVAEEYSTAIDELELSVRTHNALKRAGVDTVEQLQNMSDEELSKIRNFSQRCMDEVHKKLEEYVIKPDENVIKQDYSVIKANDSAAEPEDTEYSEITIRDYLWEEEKTLEEYERVNNAEKLPLNLMMRQRMLVKALNLLLESGKEVEEPEEEEEIIESIQPELPALKNNDQRKEWLNKYKEWGLWYRDENIDVNYYKYEFSDGSRLVVAEYPQRRMYWKPNEFKDEHYYHLLDKNRKYYGSEKTFEQQYVHSTDSETYMIEFLKNLQKDRKK